MVGFLKKMFGDAPQRPTLPTPLNLRIGAAVELDSLYFRLTADEMQFSAPDGPLLITAQGMVDLGEGTTAIRYYTDHHVMVQLLCVGGTTDAHVEEVTLYRPYDSRYPSTDADWRSWTGEGGHIGAKRCDLVAGAVYERVWFDDDPGWAAPVEFNEDVTIDAETGEKNHIRQTTMLYARPLAQDRHEYLLVSKEDSGTEASIEIMMGIDLAPGAFTVI